MGLRLELGWTLWTRVEWGWPMSSKGQCWSWLSVGLEPSSSPVCVALQPAWALDGCCEAREGPRSRPPQPGLSPLPSLLWGDSLPVLMALVSAETSCIQGSPARPTFNTPRPLTFTLSPFMIMGSQRSKPET